MWKHFNSWKKNFHIPCMYYLPQLLCLLHSFLMHINIFIFSYEFFLFFFVIIKHLMPHVLSVRCAFFGSFVGTKWIEHIFSLYFIEKLFLYPRILMLCMEIVSLVFFFLELLSIQDCRHWMFVCRYLIIKEIKYKFTIIYAAMIIKYCTI